MSVTLCVALVFAAMAPGNTRIRPFFAVLDPNNLVPPVATPSGSQSVHIELNESTGMLTLSGIYAVQPQLIQLRIRGPAPPGRAAPSLFQVAQTNLPVTVGPLAKSQIRSLKKGLIYIEFLNTLQLPPTPIARGQIVPIKGLRYSVPPAGP